MTLLILIFVGFFVFSVALGFWAGWYVRNGKVKALQEDIDNIFVAAKDRVGGLEESNKTHADVICSLLDKILEKEGLKDV